MDGRERRKIGREVRSLLSALGIEEDWSNVRKLEIYPREVLAEIYLLDGERSKYVNPETGEAATDVRRIFVTMDETP